MATTAYVPNERHGRFLHRNRVAAVAEPRVRTRSLSLGLVGLIALLASAWGGLVPFLGPTFGFSADGASSWHWNLAHALLGVIPGAIGVLVGLALMAPRRAAVMRNKVGLSWDGLLAIAAGAWFVVGPLAWPALYGHRPFFVSGAPVRELEYWVGYALGPGLILAMAGAFAIGWAARHDRPLTTSAAGAAPVTAAPQATAPGPAETRATEVA
jgi:hypothetical protein